jgi:hypothetical protein
LGTFLSLGHNLIGTANKSSSGFVSTDKVGTTTTPINAKLGKLQNNGGPTLTIGLLSGSPAIGAGSSVNAPATDQRGDARPTSGAIDIGAFEGTTTSTPTPLSSLGTPSGRSVTTGATVSVTPSAGGTAMSSAGNIPSTPVTLRVNTASVSNLSPMPTPPSPQSIADPMSQIWQDIVLMEQSLLSGNLLVFLRTLQDYESLVATAE